MVPTFLYYLSILVPVLGGANTCERICAAVTMSERCVQRSKQGHDSGSGRPHLVSSDRSGSAEASRD